MSQSVRIGSSNSGKRGLSPSRIVSRILNSATIPVTRTELLNATVISRSTLARYISYLVEEGLIEHIEFLDSNRLKTTSKGIQYLKSRDLYSEHDSERRSGSSESRRDGDGGTDDNNSGGASKREENVEESEKQNEENHPFFVSKLGCQPERSLMER